MERSAPLAIPCLGMDGFVNRFIGAHTDGRQLAYNNVGCNELVVSAYAARMS